MIAVQGAVGDIGGKATTDISGVFNSLINVNGYQFGGTGTGLYRLNAVEKTATFRLAASDYGIKNFKRFRYVYIGLECSGEVSITLTADKQRTAVYTKLVEKAGLHTIRIPIGHSLTGRFWDIEFSSSSSFRVNSIEAVMIKLAAGVGG